MSGLGTGHCVPPLEGVTDGRASVTWSKTFWNLFGLRPNSLIVPSDR